MTTSPSYITRLVRLALLPFAATEAMLADKHWAVVEVGKLNLGPKLLASWREQEEARRAAGKGSFSWT